MSLPYRTLLTCCVVTFAGMLEDARSASFIGMELEIGQSNNVVYPGSGTFWGGAAIGWSNYVEDGAAGSLAVGYLNHVHGSYNVTFGQENSITYGSYSTAIGYSNVLAGENTGGVEASLGVGIQNSLEIGVSCGIVSGFGNNVGLWAGFGESPIPVVGTATFGVGLQNKWDYATVIGRYNSNTPPNTSPSSLLFAVGNGPD